MSTNAYVDECPECGESTCLNNVSTNPPYHNLECWSCGYYSLAQICYMSEEERKELKKEMIE